MGWCTLSCGPRVLLRYFVVLGIMVVVCWYCVYMVTIFALSVDLRLYFVLCFLLLAFLFGFGDELLFTCVGWMLCL